MKKPQRSRNNGSRARIQAQRVKSCARILELLEKGPMTTRQIIDELKQGGSTVRSYLTHIKDDLHQIHVSGQVATLRTHVWTLGPGTAEQKDREATFDKRQFTIQARQVGMVRDSMLAAFFGPAGEQRA
jgi:hypothetical protein